MSDSTTPVTDTQTDDNEVIAQRAAAQRNKVLAATAVREGQKARKTTIRVTAGGKAVAPKSGDKAGTKAKGVTVKRTASERKAPVTVSKAEQAELARKSKEIQQERIAAAQKVMGETDAAQWQLAKLTFEATEDDGPGRISKSDWAAALGLSPSMVSRYVRVHREYGLPQNRQRRSRGGPELSFNDHVELTKVSDPAEQKAIRDRMQAEKTSFASALKRHREANASNGAKSKDKGVAETADLQAKALSTEGDALAAFQTLGVAAINALNSVRQVLQARGAEGLDDNWKQVLRNVLSEATDLEALFEETVG